MTEGEAKTKWCPMVRTYSGHNAGEPTMNRDYDGEIFNQCHCIASDCMMWRWATSPEEASLYRRATVEPSGYCGLAGKN